MGRKPVAAKCLEYVLEKSHVAVVGVLTDSHLQISPTAEVARRNNIPVLEFDEALEACTKGVLKFDLGISMLYWRRLRGALLEVPERGIINFHPAPLPDYKGVGGYNLAILEARQDWACSAHYVEEAIDTGPIISVNRFAIDRDRETAKSLEAKSQSVLYELYVDVVERALRHNGRLPAAANIGGTYLDRRGLEAMKRVDPEKDDIPRKVRAFWFPPYDGAYIQIGGENFTLINRAILEDLADPTSSSLFTKSSREGK